jgi:hypothetical protein
MIAARWRIVPKITQRRRELQRTELVLDTS